MMVRKGTEKLYNILIYKLLIIFKHLAKGMIKAIICPNNAIYFPASITNCCIGTLHQGGNISFVQTEQEKIAVIHIVVGQFRELLANLRNKPCQMLFSGIAQSQYLIFTKCVVLVNQIIHFRLELLLVNKVDNIKTNRGVNKCCIIIGNV